MRRIGDQMMHDSPPAPALHRALPVGLVTTCRKLLIIGGGIDTVPRSRHAALFDWHAVRILLPAPVPEVAAVAAADSRMEILFRAAAESDIEWADVVVKDSGNFGKPEEIAAWCRKHGKLLNCVDRAELCDVYYMSLLFRGPLAIGITSGGDAPALSAALRKHLETELGPGWAAAAEMMAELRRGLPPGRKRMELLRGLAGNSELIRCVLANNVQGLRRIFDDAITRIRTSG